MKEVEIQKESFADAQAREHEKIVQKALKMGMTIKEYEEWLLLQQYQIVKKEVKTLEELEKEASSLNISLEEYRKRLAQIEHSAKKSKREHKKASLKVKGLMGIASQKSSLFENVIERQESVKKNSISIMKDDEKNDDQNRQSQTLPFKEYQAWIMRNANENHMTLESYQEYLQEQANLVKLSLEEYIARLMRTEFSKASSRYQSSYATSDNWDYFDPAVIRRHIEGVRYSVPVELKRGLRPNINSKVQQRSTDEDEDNDEYDDELMNAIAKEVSSNFNLQKTNIDTPYVSVSIFVVRLEVTMKF